MRKATTTLAASDTNHIYNDDDGNNDNDDDSYDYFQVSVIKKKNNKNGQTSKRVNIDLMECDKMQKRILPCTHNLTHMNLICMVVCIVIGHNHVV